MQKKLINNIVLKFILLTEHLSFIPNNIQDVCKILYYSKLSYSSYIKLSNNNNKKFLLQKQKENLNINNNDDNDDNEYNEYNEFISNISSINSLKYIDIDNTNENLIDLKKSICNNIINIIFYNNINYNNIKNILYNI